MAFAVDFPIQSFKILCCIDLSGFRCNKTKNSRTIKRGVLGHPTSPYDIDVAIGMVGCWKALARKIEILGPGVLRKKAGQKAVDYLHHLLRWLGERVHRA